MMETIRTLAEFEELLATNEAVLAYFSTEACSVCKVLKPKVADMVEKQFNRIHSCYINCDLSPELAAQYRVFAVPAILVFFDSRETIRKSRAFGIGELEAEIARPYHMLFDAEEGI